MSGQAKRSRVRAALRHREQVARMITVACEPGSAAEPCPACGGAGNYHDDPFGHGHYEATECEACNGRGTNQGRLALAIGSGQWHFDVHTARVYAERLIAEGQRAAETWAVFVDWTRDQGLGPESWEGRTQLVNHCRHHMTVTVQLTPSSSGAAVLWPDGISITGTEGVSIGYLANTERERGGWPGHLAAEWARGPGRVKCERCKTSGVLYRVEYDNGVPTVFQVPCDTCSGCGLVEGPRPQPGDAQIRMGRRLLAALEGQPSECQRCHGDGHTSLTIGLFGERTPNPCQPCRGTGHNLAGVLPPIEWPAVVRRKAIDGYRVASPENREHFDANRQQIIDSGLDIATVRPRDPRRLLDTRSVPRGQHRALESMDMVAAIQRCTGLEEITADQSVRLWSSRELGRAPRWWYQDQVRQAELEARDATTAVEILTGTQLDRAAYRWFLLRQEGETDANLRGRVLAYARTLSG